MKKIHIVLYHLDQGGVEKTAVDLANELSDMGNSVTITTIYKSYPDKFNINESIKVRNLFGFYFKGLDRVIKMIPHNILYRMITKENFDIEIAFQSDLPTSVIASSNNAKSKKYSWVHGIGFKLSKKYNNFDKVFFVGNSLKDEYINQIEQYDLKNIEVFYNAMNVEQILSMSKDRTLLDMKDFNIVSVGRLSEEKSFERLIKTVNILRKKIPNIKLYIVGEGNERENLESVIKDLEMENIVNLIGFDVNPYKYISDADVYTCSSLYEGFNVALAEAAVIGVPIVTTNVNGARELIKNNNEYGVVVDQSIDALVSGIEYIYEERRANDRNPNHERIMAILDERSKNINKYFI